MLLFSGKIWFFCLQDWRNTLDTWRIRDIKRSSKKNLKRNFMACFAICLLLTFIVNGPMSITQTAENSKDTLALLSQTIPSEAIDNFLEHLVEGIENIRDATSIGSQSEHGALHSVYSLMSETGSLSQILLNFVTSEMNNGKVRMIIASIISLAVLIFVRVFIKDIIIVGTNRFFLENRIYKNTKITNLLFIYRVKKTWHVAMVILLKYVFHILWSLTIVGFFVKRYSYYMVPYILAENPETPAREAITLSRKMMHGHKWHTFLFEISFLPWFLLSLITFGILEYLYVNPYFYATKAELYTEIRERAYESKIENVEFLDDKYLFKAPERSILEEDVDNEICLYPEEEKQISTSKERDWLHFTPKDNYSIINLIFMFFIFSFIGWAWECALEYFKQGFFVNRGTMWGPWVPIYGVGGLMMVVLLNRFNKKPLLIFFLGIIIAGIMEYTTATILWYTEHLKYWDYSGYFLNIQGRICLEGLLFFGIMGLTGIYFFAPLSDNLLSKIPIKIRKEIATVLIVLFVADKIAVSIDPRTGIGITDEGQNP